MNQAAGYSGTLLGESLRVGAVLDEVPFTATKIFRAAAGDTAAGQPELWTFIEFTVPAEEAEALAATLSRALEPEGGWYCDFHSAAEVFVVFAGRVFRYPRGDRIERAAVEAYGQSVSVPEARLDWPE